MKCYHKYVLSSGNPEGYDWVLNVKHTKLFSEAEFQSIGEDAIIFSLKKERRLHGYSFQSSVISEHVFEYLKKLGFERDVHKCHFDFEPYWGRGRFSQKLIDFLKENEELNKKYRKKRKEGKK